MLKHITKVIFSIVIAGILNGPSFVYAQDDEDIQSQMELMRKQSAAIMQQLKTFQEQNEDLHNEGNGGKNGARKLPKKNPNMDFEQAFSMLQDQYKSMPFAQLRNHIKSTMEGTYLKPVVKAVPKTADFMAHMYQDDEAFPALFKMIKDRDKLKYVGIYILATVIAGWIFGNFYIRHNHKFATRLRRGIVKFALVWSARFAIIIYFYGDYLAPSAKIAKKVFLPEF
jgi:hypothetical protein